MKKFFVCLLCLLTVFVFSCKKNTQNTQKTLNKVNKEENLSIIAVNFPCYDFARAITVNTNSELKLLVKPGTEVHSYDPSPADIIAVQNADLFIFIGGESDEWVENILIDKQKGKTLKLIDYVNTVEENEISDNIEINDENHLEDNHHSHEEVESDEHIWTSPTNAILMVKAIEKALKEIYPKNSDIYALNSENYCSSISTIGNEIMTITNNATEKIIVMADRFPLRYFTDYYGLEYQAAFSGCSTAVEASTATLARLIDTVKEHSLPAVFYIELGNHKIADIVAEATGVKKLMLYSLQNISRTDFMNSETWVSLMQKNAISLQQGLKQ